MINLNEMVVTEIQFFDYTHEVQIGENESEIIRQYSANIALDDKLLVQLSGNDNEAHKVSIPTSAEQYWNDEDLQDWAAENLDVDDVEELLEKLGIENNFGFLSEY